MPTRVIGGLKTHYMQAGSGPDLVMIHGLASDLAFWYLSVVPALARRWRVTVYDMRGHGYTDMPPAGYTSADLASDLAAVMDHLGIDRAHLVGHSFGGSVALHFAALHPERALTLTLADARMHALQPPLPPRGSGHWETVREGLAEQGLRLPESTPIVVYSVLEELLKAPAGGDGGERARFWSFGTGRVARRKIERWIRLVETTTARDDFNAVAGLTRDVLARIARPTLAVYGALSGCRPSCDALPGLLPDVRTALLEGEGHLYPITRPDAFLSHLVPFLESQRV